MSSKHRAMIHAFSFKVIPKLIQGHLRISEHRENNLWVPCGPQDHFHNAQTTAIAYLYYPKKMCFLKK